MGVVVVLFYFVVGLYRHDVFDKVVFVGQLHFFSQSIALDFNAPYRNIEQGGNFL